MNNPSAGVTQISAAEYQAIVAASDTTRLVSLSEQSTQTVGGGAMLLQGGQGFDAETGFLILRSGEGYAKVTGGSVDRWSGNPPVFNFSFFTPSQAEGSIVEVVGTTPEADQFIYVKFSNNTYRRSQVSYWQAVSVSEADYLAARSLPTSTVVTPSV